MEHYANIPRFIMAALRETPEILKYIRDHFGAGKMLGAGGFGVVYMLPHYKGKNTTFHGQPGVLKITTMFSELESAQKMLKLQKGDQPAEWHLPVIYEAGDLPFHADNPELDESMGIEEDDPIWEGDDRWQVDYVIREYFEPWEDKWGWEEGDALTKIVYDKTGIRLDDVHRKENIGFRPYGLIPSDLGEEEEAMPWASTGKIPVALDFVDEDLR